MRQFEEPLLLCICWLIQEVLQFFIFINLTIDVGRERDCYVLSNHI